MTNNEPMTAKLADYLPKSTKEKAASIPTPDPSLKRETKPKPSRPKREFMVCPGDNLKELAEVSGGWERAAAAIGYSNGWSLRQQIDEGGVRLTVDMAAKAALADLKPQPKLSQKYADTEGRVFVSMLVPPLAVKQLKPWLDDIGAEFKVFSK